MKLIPYTRRMFKPTIWFRGFVFELYKNYEERKKGNKKMASKKDVKKLLDEIDLHSQELVYEELNSHYGTKYYHIRYKDNSLYIG